MKLFDNGDAKLLPNYVFANNYTFSYLISQVHRKKISGNSSQKLTGLLHRLYSLMRLMPLRLKEKICRGRWSVELSHS